MCECGKFITIPFINVVLPFTMVPGRLTRIAPDGTKKHFLEAQDDSGLNGRKKTRRIKHPNGIAVKRTGVVYVSEMSGFVARIEGDRASVLFSFANMFPTAIGLKNSPNGMVLTKDEKVLYVDDMRGVDIWKVHLNAEGYMDLPEAKEVTKIKKMYIGTPGQVPLYAS